MSSYDQRPCGLLPLLGVCHPSNVISFSHLNLLLWNHWTKLPSTVMVIGLSLFKTVSYSPISHWRWRLLLKIDFKNCLLQLYCQNYLKFKLQLHGNEKSNISSMFFYTWIFLSTNLYWSCKLGSLGKKHIKIFSLETIDLDETNKLGWSLIVQLQILCSSALSSSKMTAVT